MDFPDPIRNLVDDVLDVASGLEAVHPDHHGAIVAAFQQVGLAGSAFLRVDDADGSLVDVCLLDASAEFECYLALVVAASGDAPSVVDHVTEMPRRFGWTAAANGHIESVAPSVTRRLGWEAAELLGGSAVWMIHPDDRDRGIVDWIDVVATSRTISRARRRFATSNGEWVWGEVAYENRLDDPEHRDVLVEVLDVSEEMAALETLREREELLATLTEALPSGVLHLDGSGETEFANTRWRDLTGVSSDSLHDFCAAVSEPLDLAGLIESAVRSDLDIDLEVRFDLESGRSVEFALLRVRPLDNRSGAERGLLLVLDDVTMQRRRRDRLTTAALHDPLTGVLNRGGLEAELGLLMRGQESVTLLFCDLDGLKSVNDLCGHAAGDDAIRQLAASLTAIARDGDLVGRWGGDEFVVALRTADDALVARLVDDVGTRLRSWSPTEPGAPMLRCSIGVTRREDHDDVATLIDRADAAMYHVKHRRRRRSDPPVLAADAGALVAIQSGSLGHGR